MHTKSSSRRPWAPASTSLLGFHSPPPPPPALALSGPPEHRHLPTRTPTTLHSPLEPSASTATLFGATNPYEAVCGTPSLRSSQSQQLIRCTDSAKATDEKQTEANWDILLTVWDKVNEDGEAG